MTLRCQHCGQAFERSGSRGPVPKFCSNAHRQAAFRERQLRGFRTETARRRAVVARARFVADHWRLAALSADQAFAAHALCMVLAAIDGETDPEQCGIDPAAHDDFHAASR